MKIWIATALTGPIVCFDPSFAKQKKSSHTSISTISCSNFTNQTQHPTLRLSFWFMYIIKVRILCWDWGVKVEFANSTFIRQSPLKFLALNMWINLKYNLNVECQVRSVKFEWEMIDIKVWLIFWFFFAKLGSKCMIGPARAVAIQKFP